MTNILYNVTYTTDDYKNYQSHIPADVKTSFLQFQELYLTLTWSPYYQAIFKDTGKNVRTESVKINKNVDHNGLYHYKYFPNDAGTEKDWYINPGTLIAGTLDSSGGLRIIIDECCGYQNQHYTGAFEPDFLYNIIVSDKPIETNCYIELSKAQSRSMLITLQLASHTLLCESIY